MDAGRDLTGRAFYSACYAPFTSLHLDPRGVVRACCMNEWHQLGSVRQSTLRDIWDGAAATALRARLLERDFSLGCERCGLDIDAGRPDAAYLRVFDALDSSDPHPAWPRQLELALSNTCNLQCVMCNGDLSSSIRSQREHRPALPQVYGDAFFAELREALPSVDSLVFLGGEPFLARESLRVFELLDELGVRPQCHVTTNGTQWNDRVRRIVAGHRIHVAVSLDALTPSLARDIRVGVDPGRVLEVVDELRAATDHPQKGCSLAFSLMRTNWHELGAVLEWADGRDLDVFVNQVMYPTAHSLHHASVDEIRAAHEGLEAEAGHRRLGRNSATWIRERERLAALLTARSRHGDDDRADVAVAVRSPAGREVGRAVVIVGADQVVAKVDGPELVAGLSLRSLEGRSLRDLVDVLADGLGPVVSSEVRMAADGTEARDVIFGLGADATALRALQRDDAGEQRWELIFRRANV